MEGPGEPLWHAIPACRRAQLSRLRDAMAGTARIPALPTSKVESNSAWKSHLMLAGRCSSTFRVPERSEALPTSLAASSVPAVRASSLGRVVHEVCSTAQTRLRTIPALETAHCSLKSRQCSQVSWTVPLPSLPPRFPGHLPLLWRCSTFGTPPAQAPKRGSQSRESRWHGSRHAGARSMVMRFRCAAARRRAPPPWHRTAACRTA